MDKRKGRKETEVHEGCSERQGVAVVDLEAESAQTECPGAWKPGCFLYFDGSKNSPGPLVKLVQRYVAADEYRVRREKTLRGMEFGAERKYRFTVMRKQGKTPRQIRALAEERKDWRLIEICDEVISRKRKESDLRYGVSAEVLARIKAKVQNDPY